MFSLLSVIERRKFLQIRVPHFEKPWIQKINQFGKFEKNFPNRLIFCIRWFFDMRNANLKEFFDFDNNNNQTFLAHFRNVTGCIKTWVGRFVHVFYYPHKITFMGHFRIFEKNSDWKNMKKSSKFRFFSIHPVMFNFSHGIKFFRNVNLPFLAHISLNLILLINSYWRSSYSLILDVAKSLEALYLGIYLQGSIHMMCRIF
jgi:hypothetical protein